MTPRQAAILELLQRPDDDGQRRANTLKQEGKPSRFGLLILLPLVHTNLKRHERDGEISCD